MHALSVHLLTHFGILLFTPHRPWPSSASGSEPAPRSFCGICGQRGHNQRTCPGAPAASAVPTRRTNLCGTCRQPGHDRRQCPVVRPALFVCGEYDTFREADVTPYIVGDSQRCPHGCGAWQYPGEFAARACPGCANGRFLRGRGLPRPPRAIELLLTVGGAVAKAFSDCLRAFNSSYSFASMQAELLRPTSSGPPIMVVEGGVYTAIGPMEVPHHRPASALQIYFLDGSDDGRRQQRLLVANLDRGDDAASINQLMQLLDAILRDHPHKRELLTLREQLRTGAPGQEVVEQAHFRLIADNAGPYERQTSSEVTGIVDDRSGADGPPRVTIFERGRRRRPPERPLTEEEARIEEEAENRPEGAGNVQPPLPAPSSVRSLTTLNAAHDVLTYSMLYFNNVFPGGWHARMQQDNQCDPSQLTLLEQSNMDRAEQARRCGPHSTRRRRTTLTQNDQAMSMLSPRESIDDAFHRATIAARIRGVDPPRRPMLQQECEAVLRAAAADHTDRAAAAVALLRADTFMRRNRRAPGRGSALTDPVHGGHEMAGGPAQEREGREEGMEEEDATLPRQEREQGGQGEDYDDDDQYEFSDGGGVDERDTSDPLPQAAIDRAVAAVRPETEEAQRVREAEEAGAKIVREECGLTDAGEHLTLEQQRQVTVPAGEDYDYLFRCGKLLQQYCIHLRIKADDNRLNYIRTHQAALLAGRTAYRTDGSRGASSSQ